ncbi:hypothetical protein JTB14_014984 [Gonioctena quinquepunctata]|nr:hypothetical protein JTB14_014984 [Gonioctena quinquepunctata]
MLLRLEVFFKEKYPDLKNTSDSDLSNMLEDKEVSDDNKKFKQIPSRVKKIICIHPSEKFEKHHARFEQIANSLEYQIEVLNITNEHNIQDNSSSCI